MRSHRFQRSQSSSPAAFAATAILAVTALLAATACGTTRQFQARSSALEYLYPRGVDARPPADVILRLPVRVGVAFAPARPAYQDRFTASQKQALLERVAAAFRGGQGIGSVEVIPPGYLTLPPAPPPAGGAPAGGAPPAGDGFLELDRVKAAFGIDLVALISYDQMQFSETGRSSWAYWTIVGAYVIKGEKNETRTLMDAVVYDVPSRALLFHASGNSTVAAAATPVDVDRVLRQHSEEGFETATTDLIANLGTALGQFQQQAATGTVRGPGTPAVAVLGPDGQPVPGGGSGDTDGSGAVGAVELAGAVLLMLLALRERRVAARRR
jgi:rhombotail lipoprotein